MIIEVVEPVKEGRYTLRLWPDEVAFVCRIAAHRQKSFTESLYLVIDRGMQEMAKEVR